MGLNKSGLCGRNVKFYFRKKIIKGYIIYYNAYGEYFALDKKNGDLYKVYADKKYTLAFERATYDELQKDGIEINGNNWKSFIDYSYKNKFITSTDICEFLRSVCLILILCTLAAILCAKLANSNKTVASLWAVFACEGIALFSFNLYSVTSYEFDDIASRKWLHHVSGNIENAYREIYNDRYRYQYKDRYSEKKQKNMLIIAIVIAVIGLFDIVVMLFNGMFDVMSILASLIFSLPAFVIIIFYILLKTKHNPVGLMWCILTSVFFVNCLGGILPFGRPIPTVFPYFLAGFIISLSMFLYRNISWHNIKKQEAQRLSNHVREG